MLIMGCDFHPGFQQLAIFDKSTAEVSYRRLRHPEEARGFYASLAEPAQVGMEACGSTQWFERLLAALGPRVVAGRCGADSGLGGAAAEDGPARRGAPSQLAAGAAFSAVMGAQPGGARCAAVAVASPSSGAQPDAGEESTASDGVEPVAAPVCLDNANVVIDRMTAVTRTSSA